MSFILGGGDCCQPLPRIQTTYSLVRWIFFIASFRYQKAEQLTLRRWEGCVFDNRGND